MIAMTETDLGTRVSSMEKRVDGMKSQLEKNLNILDRLEQLWKQRWIERAKAKGIQIDETQSAEVIASLVVEGSGKPSDPSMELIQPTIMREKYYLRTREIESPMLPSDHATKLEGSSKCSDPSRETTQLTEKNDRWMQSPQMVMQERGKFREEGLFVFVDTDRGGTHQHDGENPTETKRVKYACQVFDKMHMRGKRVMKKRKKKRWKEIAEKNFRPCKKSEISQKTEGVEVKKLARWLHCKVMKCSAEKMTSVETRIHHHLVLDRRLLLTFEMMERRAKWEHIRKGIKLNYQTVHARRLSMVGNPYMRHVFSRNCCSRFRKKKKKTRFEGHVRKHIKSDKNGKYSRRMGKTKIEYEMNRIKQELMFAELLWRRKTAVKKMAKWKKHRFKQKQNKQKGKIKSRLPGNQIFVIRNSKLELELFRKYFSRWSTINHYEKVYMRNDKLLQLNGLVKLYWELLLAAYTIKRAKTKFRDMLNRGNLWLDITDWTKVKIKWKEQRFRCKYRSKRSSWKHADFLVNHLLKLKQTEKHPCDWCKEKHHRYQRAYGINALIYVTMVIWLMKVEKKQYLTRRKRAKFRRKYMKKKMKLGMNKKEKHAELFPELWLSTAGTKKYTEREMKLCVNKKEKAEHKYQNKLKAKVKGSFSMNHSVSPLNFNLELKLLGNILVEWREEEQESQRVFSKWLQLKSIMLPKCLEKGDSLVKELFEGADCKGACALFLGESVTIMGTRTQEGRGVVQLQKIMLGTGKQSRFMQASDGSYEFCFVMNLLVFYVKTLATLEDKEKGLIWDSSDVEVQSWGFNVLVLKLPSQSGEDTATYIFCFLGLVCSWGEKNKQERTEEAQEFELAAGQNDPKAVGELVRDVSTPSLIEEEVLQEDSEAEMGYQRNHISGREEAFKEGLDSRVTRTHGKVRMAAKVSISFCIQSGLYLVVAEQQGITVPSV